MSASETDSDSEPVLAPDTVSSLSAFARLSTTRQPDPTGQSTVSWAVDTLATLEFRLVRKDDALHGLIQNCASTILALCDTVLQRGPATDTSCGFIPDVASILRPSFLHLLFQYRRLFRIIAARDFKPNAAPLATVCWVDVVLAKLGDVAALIAVGFDGDPYQSLPESLMAQRQEDNLRAAIQLPDNWDMLPSVPLSERASAAAKRLSLRLMLTRYILGPALSGWADVDNNIHQLFFTLAELVRQSATRVEELRSASGPDLRYHLQQERLTSAMTVSLFAAADIAQDSSVNPERATAFRPRTMAAAMQLLRFVLNDGTTQMNVLSPSDRLDTPTSVIIRWGIVPQWAWSVWLEHSSLHADTIMHLTTTYIRHHSPGPFPEVSDLMSTDSRSSEPAVINVMIDLIFRFISLLSVGSHPRQLSTGMMSVLHRSCQLISQWMNRNSCGIQRSKECCKALIILFGYLSQNEHLALNGLVIECLALFRGQCIQEAWQAAAEDKKSCFLEALDQSFIQTKTALSRGELSMSREVCAGQMMQFLVVLTSKGVQPLNPDAFVDFIEAVSQRVLEGAVNDREFLCETLLICLATANLSEIDFPWSKASMAVDDEAIWRLSMCGGGANLFLASAFSLYITSTLVRVEPLTYVEGLEHLLDVTLLICSRHYPSEDEPLALIILPTICDALAHLLGHRDDTTRVYTYGNNRMSALESVLRAMGNGEDEDPMCVRYGTLLRRQLSSTAGRVLREMNGEYEGGGVKREYELVFCGQDGVRSRLVLV